MKKLVVLILLTAGHCLAQGRPSKVICFELGSVDPVSGEFVGCAAIDSEEVVELKNLFNLLVTQLNGQLAIQREFRPQEVTRRFAEFDDRIAVLQRVVDAVKDRAVKQAFQDRLDSTIVLRDKFHSTDPDSPRDIASRVQAAIDKLGLQLDDIEAAISDFEQ